jgi:hypothetical protein
LNRQQLPASINARLVLPNSYRQIKSRTGLELQTAGFALAASPCQKPPETGRLSVEIGSQNLL